MYTSRLYRKNILVVAALVLVLIFMFIMVKSYKIAKVRKNIDSLPTIKNNEDVVKIKHKVRELPTGANTFYDSLRKDENTDTEVQVIEKSTGTAGTPNEITIPKSRKNEIVDKYEDEEEDVVISENIKEVVINEKESIEREPKVAANASKISIQNNFYKAQLVAVRNKQQARNFIGKTKKIYGNLLKDLDIFVVEVNLNEKGMFYRVQVGNFNTKGEAAEFCKTYI
ncbi:MAG: SPOR domain-containing protein, partial [Rickettsiales bacterium]|nr:SPOR domain-containing protein [Rickettsiales bacterium]